MNLIEELEKQEKISPDKLTRVRLIGQFSQICERFNNYRVVELMFALLRKKSDSEDPRDWSDEKLLKKVETMFKSMIEDEG